MKRQVILLEDLIDVFVQELGHVLEDVDPPGPGRPPVYPANGMFLCWLFIYLGVAVDVITLRKNPSPNLYRYRNVIVGSGVRIQRVYKEALEFLEKDFEDKKVAIFLSSLFRCRHKVHQKHLGKNIDFLAKRVEKIKRSLLIPYHRCGPDTRGDTEPFLVWLASCFFSVSILLYAGPLIIILY